MYFMQFLSISQIWNFYKIAPKVLLLFNLVPNPKTCKLTIFNDKL